MTRKLPETLQDKVEEHLLDSGGWEFTGAPYLAWLDLRAKALGDGRAVPVGEAVQRQLAYEDQDLRARGLL
jgi:hypothetical protein